MLTVVNIDNFVQLFFSRRQHECNTEQYYHVNILNGQCSYVSQRNGNREKQSLLI